MGWAKWFAQTHDKNLTIGLKTFIGLDQNTLHLLYLLNHILLFMRGLSDRPSNHLLNHKPTSLLSHGRPHATTVVSNQVIGTWLDRERSWESLCGDDVASHRVGGTRQWRPRSNQQHISPLRLGYLQWPQILIFGVLDRRFVVIGLRNKQSQAQVETIVVTDFLKLRYNPHAFQFLPKLI